MELDKTHVDNKDLKFIKHVRSQSMYVIIYVLLKLYIFYICCLHSYN